MRRPFLSLWEYVITDNTNKEFYDSLNNYFLRQGVNMRDVSPLMLDACAFSYQEGHSDGVHEGYQLACDAIARNSRKKKQA